MNFLRILASCCPFFITPPIEFDDFTDYEYDEDYLMTPQRSIEQPAIVGPYAPIFIKSSEVTECDDLVVLYEPIVTPLDDECNSTSSDAPQAN